MTSEIIAGLALAVGVANTAWQVHTYSRKHALERSDQAKDVDLMMRREISEGSASLVLTVTNNSNSPIYDVVVSSDDVVSAQAHAGEKLAPGGVLSVVARRFADGKMPLDDSPYTNINGQVRFRDARGARWLRQDDMQLLDLDKRKNADLRVIPWRALADPISLPKDAGYSKVN